MLIISKKHCKMKKLAISALLMALLMTISGCSVVEGIFKTGMGVGIFVVVAVIGLIIFLVTRLGKK